MSPDPFLQEAPLFALGVLDRGEDKAFATHVDTCPECRAEVRAHDRVLALLAVSEEPRAPRARVREAVLSSLASASAPAPGPRAVARAASRPARTWPMAVAASLLIAVLGAALWQARRDRDLALEASRTASARAETLGRELAELSAEVSRHTAAQSLLAEPGARVTSLAGLAPAPGARAGVLWVEGQREAVLVTLGLRPAPEGKAYELWVIAGGAPVPAGVFQVDAQGRTVLHIPPGTTGGARTFAVTLEPAGGTPAPTGPMVLAGNVS
jgi:anti-sigma-K factor RskA